MIVGGGLGGCAAALAALRAGRTVVLTEPTDWIGGQLTSQAVPPDEHPWIEQFGAQCLLPGTPRRHPRLLSPALPLTAEAARGAMLNPGNGNVSQLCHEPRVALAVLTRCSRLTASSGRLAGACSSTSRSAPTSQGDRVRAVTVRDRQTGRERALVAPYFLDATELGDLLPLAGVEFVTGAEGRTRPASRTRPARTQPDNQQAITCCFAIDYLEGQDHTIDRPAEYDFWKTYVPAVNPLAGPAARLDLRRSDHAQAGQPRLRPARARGTACGSIGGSSTLAISSPARIPAARDHAGQLAAERLLARPLIGAEVTPADAARHIARAKQLSLSLLYWLQTECPRPDGKTGWKGLRLRPDLVGTDDGLAKAPYIRESRRIQAEFTVLEQHVGTEARRSKSRRSQDVQAEPFPDSVGVGSYRIDLHPSTGGDNYIDISSLPFQIPLGALIPRRVENLLPACKNLGTTHITNGCYRLHPVEWAIGEAAGALAAFCLEHKESPRAVRNTPEQLEAFQARLTGQGVEIAWPRLTAR